VLTKNTLLLEPHLQSVLLWLFWEWGSPKLFAQAGFEPKSSEVVRINGVSHQHPFVCLFIYLKQGLVASNWIFLL
jgi:hypothetical protein